MEVRGHDIFQPTYYLPGESKKFHEEREPVSRSPGRHSNPEVAEYEVGMPTI
jgi:hypothetical protein